MVELEGIRRALYVATATAALLACGRTEGLLPSWSDEIGGTTATGGTISARGGAPSESRAGASGVAQSASAGRAGMHASAGSAGSLLGGAAGFALDGVAGFALGSGGAGGSAHLLEACAPAATLILDGPLATQLDHLPTTAVAGDWNRDGKLDLATGNDDGSISVLFGKGDGSFASSVTYTNGSGPSPLASPRIFLAARDLDGNGSLDLVTTPADSPGVRVLLGAADGSFASPVTYVLDGDSVELAFGDFDSDGDPDIAVAGRTGVVLLPNHGDGSFGVGVKLSTADDRLNGIAADDLNHDGRVDLVTLSDSELTVLLGNGDGSFVETQTLAGSIYNDPLRIADINADGHPDLLYPQTCGPRSRSASSDLFLGRGDGTFSNAVSTITEASCDGGVAVVDVNADGAADVVKTSPVTVLFGSKDGLLPPVRSSKSGGGNLLATGDWNGDGKLDLATAGHEWITVQLGNGDGTFGSNSVYRTSYGSGSLALTDLDADGMLDVAATTSESGEHGPTVTSLTVLRGLGDGTFLHHVDYSSTPESSVSTGIDLNGDGRPDLVTSAGESIAVRLGTGNLGFAPEVTWLAGKNVVALAVGDLNADGHSDVAAAISSTANLALFFGTGDGMFAPIRSLQLPDPAAGVIAADVNGDAKQDLVVTLMESSTVAVLLGNGDGSFALDQLYPTKGAAGIAPADLNADGNVDLVVFSTHCCGDSFSVFLGAANGRFAPRLDYPAGPNELAAVDFNQDGRQDLVMLDDLGIEILYGAGDGTFTCMTRYVGDSMHGLGIGDLNHDGRIDVVTTTHAGLNVFLNTTP